VRKHAQIPPLWFDCCACPCVHVRSYELVCPCTCHVCSTCSTGVHACRGLAQNYGRGTLQGFALVHGLQDTQKASVGVKIGRAYHIPTRRTVVSVPLVAVLVMAQSKPRSPRSIVHMSHHGPSEGARAWGHTSDAWPTHLAAPASELGSLMLALDSGARLFCSTRS
jgi:hypothetical protein